MKTCTLHYIEDQVLEHSELGYAGPSHRLALQYKPQGSDLVGDVRSRCTSRAPSNQHICEWARSRT